MSGYDFLVRRNDLHQHRIAPAVMGDSAVLEPNDVLLRVDRFALTSNNITYAEFGDQRSYWDFFPAPDGWGIIPVWGFGTVIRSAHPGVAPGSRFYGYLPMSSSVRVCPDRVGPAGFVDRVPHRRALHPLYSQYADVSTDPLYDAQTEGYQLVLRPLFITSFILEDLLAENSDFGAESVIISSASSKTAYGLAFLLTGNRRAGGRPRVIGLTSPANVPFVERLGVYDAVDTYDAAISSFPLQASATYVDFSGNPAHRERLRRFLGAHLVYTCSVGGLHRGTLDVGAASFFSPDRISARARELGRVEFQQRFASAWRRFLDFQRSNADSLLTIVEETGPEAVERVYLELLENRANARDGHVLSLAV